LPARRDEHRHLVAASDLEHAVERLLRETARNQHQQLALPDRPPAPHRERVVDVDRRMLDPVPLAEAARDQGGVVHELEVGTPLQQPLGQQIPAAVVGRRQQTEVQRLESGEHGHGNPEDRGQPRPERRETWADQI